MNASTRGHYGPNSSYIPLRTTGSMTLETASVRVTARDTLTGSVSIEASVPSRALWYVMKVEGGIGRAPQDCRDRGRYCADGTTFTRTFGPGHYILKAKWRGRELGRAEFSVCPCVEVAASHASSVWEAPKWVVTYDFTATLVGGGTGVTVTTTNPDNVVDPITVDGLTWTAVVRHAYAPLWQEMVTVTPVGSGTAVQLIYGPT